MSKYIYVVLFVFFLTSCSKKSVELPLIPVSGTTNIFNYSEIWVFYKLDKQEVKANANLNNVISSTHWIINIDKKLPMQEIVPILETIKEKRAKKSPHSVENMNNYLSYSNTKDKNISLINIDSTQYLILGAKEYEELINHYKSDINIELSENSFTLNQTEYPLDAFNEELLKPLKNVPIHFFYKGDVAYQTYLEKKVMLYQYVSQKNLIDSTEYLLNN